MDITCPACRSRFSLKTDKLPKGPFRVVCGKCRHPFTVDPAKEAANTTAPTVPDLANGHPPPAAAPPAAAPPTAAPRAPEPAAAAPRAPEPAAAQRAPEPRATAPVSAASPVRPVAAAPAAPAAAARQPETATAGATLAGAEGNQAPPVEEFSENLRLALVCVDRAELQGPLKSALAELGYKSHCPPGHKEALMWVNQNKYEVVLIDEEFAGAQPGNHAVHEGFAFMPMQLRRQMCVGLIGRNLRTMDNMTAYHKSVNFTMSEKDCLRAKTIIRSAVTDNDEFYRTFKEVMKQLGKT